MFLLFAAVNLGVFTEMDRAIQVNLSTSLKQALPY
jgi:hypothetical protein